MPIAQIIDNAEREFNEMNQDGLNEKEMLLAESTMSTKSRSDGVDHPGTERLHFTKQKQSGLGPIAERREQEMAEELPMDQHPTRHSVFSEAAETMMDDVVHSQSITDSLPPPPVEAQCTESAEFVIFGLTLSPTNSLRKCPGKCIYFRSLKKLKIISFLNRIQSHQQSE